MQSVTPFDDILLLDAAEVERHLPMRDCIEAMDRAFAALARGDAVLPVRSVIPVPDGAGSLYTMPGFLGGGDGEALAVKMVTLFPGNAARGQHTHQGVIVLFDAADGRVLSVIEAGSVTAIRTAAVSALATRLLALPDADELALLGSGVQAGSHLSAMLEVRPIRRVRVWSRTFDHAESFARSARAIHGIAVHAVSDAEAAVRGAAIVCTLTGSPEPVLRSAWLGEGVHVNAVGASTAATREIDSATIERARIVVDSRAAAAVEAGDLLLARRDGVAIDVTSVPELAEVVAGAASPRTSARDVTLFESLGLAIEDVAAARTVYRRAREAGEGA